MNKISYVGSALALAGAGFSVFAASPPATVKTEWNLSGKLKGRAFLVCKDPAPAPEKPVQQAIPNPVAVRKWVAKLQFAPDGTFKYFEIDSNAQEQPLDKWTQYQGTWTQTGDKVALDLDTKSSAALYTGYSGGSKCGSSNPCYNSQRYRFSGRLGSTHGNQPKLALKELVLFRVNNIVAPGAYACHGRWIYTKHLSGE